MTTVDALVNRTIRALEARQRGRYAVLQQGSLLGSGTTTITLANAEPMVDNGSVIQIDYELMLVIGVSGTTLTVVRGFLGTTAATHTDGTLVEIEPRWPRQSVLDALEEEIRSWPPDVHQIATTDVTFPSGSSTVDFTGTSGVEVYRVLDASVLADRSTRVRRLRVDLLTDQATAAFPTGNALRIRDGLVYGTATTVRVRYGAAFDLSSFTATDDLQSDMGIPSSLNDAARFGAGARLMVERDADRNETAAQGQSRYAEEVPPQSWARTAAVWRDEANRLVSQERDRLFAQAPWSH